MGGDSDMIVNKKISSYLNTCYDRGYSEVFLNKKGSLAGSAVGILVLLVTLMLCALLFGTLQGQVDDKISTLNDANATESFSHIKETGWSSIDLFGLVPYIAVFLIMLGMLMGIARD